MKKYFAELVGTFILVLFGVGTAVVAGDKVGILGIAFAFGLGADRRRLRHRPHLRLPHQPRGQPGRLDVAGRMSHQGHAWLLGRASSWAAHWPRWVLYVIVSGVGGGYNIAASGLGQDGWGPGYQGGYSIASAIVFEFVATLIFVIVILGSTQKSAPEGVCRPGHRHHAGGNSHLRHSHHRRKRKPGPQPGSGASCWRKGPRAGVALPAGSHPWRRRRWPAVPLKALQTD